MSVKYSCFISYCHGKRELVSEFIPQLKKTLEAHLEPYLEEEELEVFCDTEDINPGNLYEETIAQAICNSLCMIVVYSPKYELHQFCLREFRAMEILEKKRLKRLGKNVPKDSGMIIPLIWRGDIGNLPPRISNIRQHCDFTRITCARNLRNQQALKKIDDIALYIYNLYKFFDKCGWDPFEKCPSFRLPDVNEVPPLRDSNKPHSAPFPGRWSGP